MYYLRRVTAYIIDILLLTLILSLIYQINGINPHQEEYMKYSQTYSEHLVEKNKTEFDFEEYSYNITLYGKVFVVVDIIIFFLYFVLFQKYNNGQTVGKKLMKLRLIQKPKSKNLTLIGRLLLIYGLVPSILNITLISILQKQNYLTLSKNIGLANSLFILFILIFMILRKENLALHDKLCKTEVVDLKNEI